MAGTEARVIWNSDARGRTIDAEGGAIIPAGLWAGEVQPIPSSTQWDLQRWQLQSRRRRIDLQPIAAQVTLLLRVGAGIIVAGAATGLEIGSRSSEPGKEPGETGGC